MMKKVLAWLLVLSLTAAISIGATLAYLTDTDEDVNVMTLGKVKIDQLEYERVNDETANQDAKVQEFHDNKPLYPAITGNGFDYTPGDTKVDWTQIGKDGYTSPIWDPTKINNEVDKMVFVKNKGDYDAYVRSVFAFEAGNYKTLDEFRKMVHLNLNETNFDWEWIATPVTIGGSTYFVATATYNKVLAPGALTEISLSQIALDKTATNEDVKAFGDTYQILVKSQGIQADGFDDPTLALDEGFGVISETKVPWDNDVPTKGITVRQALHYLDGDNTTTAITANVSSVTFGLNENYTSIVDANTGVLVDVEQDVPVYAYYVKNGSNYDVYFLADDDIYLPKDSSTLMMDMTALTAVNTENLNTSRTENMKQLFRKCAKLETLNTTDWDTSKVESMYQVFYQCKALQSIPGIEDWETGAATSMRGMFRECGVKGDLDLSGWDVSNVTEMYQMFYKAPNLVNLNAEGWKMGDCTTMQQMFFALPNLETVNAAGWDTSSVTNMYGTFYENFKLRSLNVTGWDTSNVTDAYCLFTRCRALEEMIGSGGLNFGKVPVMGAMCAGWDSMTYLDATNWNCGSCTDMGQMFGWALKLKTIKGIENWDVSNVTIFSEMFRFSYELENLNLSTWKPSSGEKFNSMFADCPKFNPDKDIFDNWDMSSAVRINHMFDGSGVQHLNLSGWNMPNLVTTTHMFADCTDLKSVDFTGWNTPNLISLDCMFNDCDDLTYLNVSSFDTANCREFSQLFEGCRRLEKIDGLEMWDTSNARTYESTFSGCSALKELNLTAFNTRNVVNDHWMDWQPGNTQNIGYGCKYMLSGMTSLEKLTLSADFSFDGDGKVTTESYKVKLPAPAAKEGFTAKWQDVDTGVLYDASEIHEEKAATYVAYYEPNATNP